ncbi:hypothetical protein ACFE04_021500 [Oxalis oulophora]
MHMFQVCTPMLGGEMAPFSSPLNLPVVKLLDQHFEEKALSPGFRAEIAAHIERKRPKAVSTNCNALPLLPSQDDECFPLYVCYDNLVKREYIPHKIRVISPYIGYNKSYPPRYSSSTK